MKQKVILKDSWRYQLYRFVIDQINKETVSTSKIKVAPDKIVPPPVLEALQERKQMSGCDYRATIFLGLVLILAIKVVEGILKIGRFLETYFPEKIIRFLFALFLGVFSVLLAVSGLLIFLLSVIEMTPDGALQLFYIVWAALFGGGFLVLFLLLARRYKWPLNKWLIVLKQQALKLKDAVCRTEFVFEESQGAKNGNS